MVFVSNLTMAFQLVVDRHGSKIALHYPQDGERISYHQLAVLVDKIINDLVYRGYRQGDVGAMFHDKSPAAFACMLACIRLGIIYTNLDPDSPWERLRKILAVSQPTFIVNAFDNLVHRRDIEEVCEVIEIGQMLNSCPYLEVDLPHVADIPGSSPAYIMYTSGSTGFPKGAVMSHANLLSFIDWSKDQFKISPDDIFTNVNPIYFDNSVFDFYTAIFSGATLVPFNQRQVKDARLMLQLAEENGCTIWFSVPSLLVYLLSTRSLSRQSLPQIRKIIFGGEGFPKSKLKQLFDMFGDRVELENVYGPTECTCICSAHTISDADFVVMQDLATIGILSQNFQGMILPLEETDPNYGELVLFGTQVGLGYYNDHERTDKSFIQNPRHIRYRDIGYLTGDLVRRNETGQLFFKGRADLQVKHMGYRIELEEIEAVLSTVFGIDECAVVYQKLGDGMGQVLGFVTCDRDLNCEMLLSKLRTLLPYYMIPKRIEILSSMPKNANGKVDRQLLASEISL